jgi:hypothetical protein
MEFIIWVESRIDGKTLDITEVAKIARTAPVVTAEELGLTLSDGRVVVRQVQACMVRTQVAVVTAAARGCIHCERNKRMKDSRRRRLHTVFGAPRACSPTI